MEPNQDQNKNIPALGSVCIIVARDNRINLLLLSNVLHLEHNTDTNEIHVVNLGCR